MMPLRWWCHAIDKCEKSNRRCFCCAFFYCVPACFVWFYVNKKRLFIGRFWIVISELRVLGTFRSRIVLLCKFVFGCCFVGFVMWFCCAFFSDKSRGSTCWRFRCWSSLLPMKLQGKNWNILFVSYLIFSLNLIQRYSDILSVALWNECLHIILHCHGFR